MSNLKKEIAETKTEIKGTKVKNNQPQPLTEDLLDQISGGWVNAYARWTNRF